MTTTRSNNKRSAPSPGKDQSSTQKHATSDEPQSEEVTGEQDDQQTKEPAKKKQKTLEEVGITSDDKSEDEKKEDQIDLTKGDSEGEEKMDVDVDQKQQEEIQVEDDQNEHEKDKTNDSEKQSNKSDTEASQDEAKVQAEKDQADIISAEATESKAQKISHPDETETETKTDSKPTTTTSNDNSKTESETGVQSKYQDSEEVKKATKVQIEKEKDLVGHEDIKEYGQVFFLFRPRVETPHPKSISDVQRLHIILQPHSTTTTSNNTSSSPTSVTDNKPLKSRLITLAKKVLPGKGSPTGGQGGRGETFWGYVNAVEEDVESLKGVIGETSQQTKTMGERVTPADRIIGTGPYCILSQSSSKDPSNPRRNTYLLYTLTAPLEMGPVQKAFNLSKEGSFGVNVKNPKGGDRQGTGLPNKAEFSEELQSKMSTLRWHPIDPPQYLDYPNAELIFTAASPHSLSETLEKTTEDHAKMDDKDEGHAEHEGKEIADDMRKIAEMEGVEHGYDLENEHEQEDVQGGVVNWVMGMLRGKGTVAGGEESLIHGHWE